MKNNLKIIIFITSLMITMGSLNSLFSSDHLNYGIYWLGYDGAKQKFEPGVYNEFYNPDNPTVIFFHGWHKSRKGKGASNVDLYSEKGSTWTHNGWLDKGWNVGIFNWAQWCNEGDVKWAEAKIWTRNGPKGFRYRLVDGSYGTASNPSGNGAVGELARDIIIEALENFNNPNLRFVGNSLGVQLAIRTAELIFDEIMKGNIDENKYSINRLALLEPAWTKNGKEWLGDENGDGKNDWVGERGRWAIFEMMEYWSDLAVEIYNTTALDKNLVVAMDSNKPLREKICGTVSVKPGYYNVVQLGQKHNVAFFHYFWSMAFDAPPECTVHWWKRQKTGAMGPSASTPDWRIREMMGNKYKWDQIEGRDTPDPGDDWFERKKF